MAGTKGKGTTCAYVDSILSQFQEKYSFPKKIGLYTSPHLITVRERIRINSTPISSELFAKYFFEVYDLLEPQLAKENKVLSGTDDKAAAVVYFRYLTLLSYHIFLQEGVDAAIYETGVGGELDSTNIVEHPACTGITALGIDHTHTLGNTIEEIAWHKAGIQKTGSPSFTVTQPANALKVLQAVANERNVNLTVELSRKRIDQVKIYPNKDFQRYVYFFRPFPLDLNCVALQDKLLC